MTSKDIKEKLQKILDENRRDDNVPVSNMATMNDYLQALFGQLGYCTPTSILETLEVTFILYIIIHIQYIYTYIYIH